MLKQINLGEILKQKHLQDSKSFIKLTLSKVMENEMPIEV